MQQRNVNRMNLTTIELLIFTQKSMLLYKFRSNFSHKISFPTKKMRLFQFFQASFAFKSMNQAQEKHQEKTCK